MSSIVDVNEQSLPEREEYFRRLVETAPGAIVIINEHGDIVLANARVEILFGYTQQELVGQPIEILLPRRSRKSHVAYRGNYMTTPEVRPMGIGRDLAGRHKGGKEFPVEIGLSYIRTENGTFAFAFVTDITERKRAEEERQQLLVREQEAREKAEQAVKMRDEFLSVAAHELRTPVTSMRGFAQLLLRRILKGDDLATLQLQRSLEQINEQSIKLTRLIGHLLDVARIEAGRLTIEKEVIDIANLVCTTAETMQRTTSKHTITVDSPSQMMVSGDALRLEQAIVNLLDNAIKFSEGGLIHVAVTALNSQTIMISVTDKGVGIPSDRRENLFSRFYQAHAEGYKGGMGIGLYVSSQIIALHNGTVEAEFPPEGGTRFVITLPIDSSKTALPPNSP
jgi:PAS domain S-box-containing protein